MIAGARMVRMSKRAERGMFAGHRRLDLARSTFLTARRIAAWKRSKLRGQVLAYQALNVLGVRIWANKPRFFGDYRWFSRRATVARFCALSANGGAAFSDRRGLYAARREAWL